LNRKKRKRWFHMRTRAEMQVNTGENRGKSFRKDVLRKIWKNLHQWRDKQGRGKKTLRKLDSRVRGNQGGNGWKRVR